MLYTLNQWGVRQREIYSAKLSETLDTLAHFPELGEARDDLAPGLFSRRIEQHVVYYRVTPKMLQVIRFRHAKADEFRPIDL
jgi:plasmid stabilization system protein ParE